MKIGITERGDAALHLAWVPWVKEGKPAILITKDPERLCSRLHGHDVADANIIVHCTITGLGGSKVEPHVPKPHGAIHYYKQLVRMLGMERVILRIDPIIPTERGTARARFVASHCETRMRISFLDNYPHVRRRFRDAGLPVLGYDFHAPLDTRTHIWQEFGEPEVCGEPGMKCSGCVSAKDLKVLGVEVEPGRSKQRGACMCLAQKHELLNHRGQCKHGCLYCYWK